jgi:ABC-type transport system involved in multi-copper enzyme maturation permease subunit
MKLFLFEWKKTFFSKRFLFILFFLFLGIVLLFIQNILFQPEIEREERMEISSMLDTAHAFSRDHQFMVDEEPDNETEQELLLLNSKNIDILYEMRNMVGSEDAMQKLQLENELYQGIEEYMLAGGEPLLAPEMLEHRTRHNEKLMAENIKPQHERYSLAMPNFMKQVVDLLLSFGAVILFILILGDKLSSEYENRTIYLLFTEPLKKEKIITSKFLSSSALYLFAIIVLFSIAALVSGIVGETGTFSYPLTREINHEIYDMTIGEYVIQAVIIILITVIFLISLTLFYSQWIKNTLPTLFVLLLTIGAGVAVSLFIPWSGIHWVNPFQYILGQDAILMQNERVWWQGIPILILLSLVFWFLSRKAIQSNKLHG